MLSESRQLLSCLNTQMVPAATQSYDQHVVEITDQSNQVIGIVGAVPFIRARDVMVSSAGQKADDKKASLQQAISDYYQSIFDCAHERQQQLDEVVPIVMTGHLTTVNSQKSESVRDLYIGTLDAFPCDAFPAADYIALGHIHRSQPVGGLEHIRYCGSPIPLSFDELNKPKSVCLVDFEQGKRERVEEIEVPLFQPMQVIKGSLEQIESQLKEVTVGKLDKPVWLDIEVAAQDFISDIQQRLQQLTQGLNVEVLLSRREKTERQNGVTRQQQETLQELSVNDVFKRRLDDELVEDDRNDSEQERFNRLTTRFQQVVAEVDESQDGSAQQVQSGLEEQVL